MGCPACAMDYDLLEQEIDTGRLKNRQQLEDRLAAAELYFGGATVIYCPGCREKIAQLMDQVASKLRQQTLAGIHDLLDRAHEERKKSR